MKSNARMTHSVYTLQAKHVRYSARERQIFDLLPQDGRMISSDTLIEKFWGKSREEEPFHKRVTAMGSLRSLRAKVERNHEAFDIQVSEPSGPKPQEIWLTKRK
jgi:DNA-binding response OmpR family regulator